MGLEERDERGHADLDQAGLEKPLSKGKQHQKARKESIFKTLKTRPIISQMQSLKNRPSEFLKCIKFVKRRP